MLISIAVILGIFAALAAVMIVFSSLLIWLTGRVMSRPEVTLMASFGYTTATVLLILLVPIAAFFLEYFLGGGVVIKQELHARLIWYLIASALVYVIAAFPLMMWVFQWSVGDTLLFAITAIFVNWVLSFILAFVAFLAMGPPGE
jgi:hypothetical protein